MWRCALALDSNGKPSPHRHQTQRSVNLNTFPPPQRAQKNAAATQKRARKKPRTAHAQDRAKMRARALPDQTPCRFDIYGGVVAVDVRRGLTASRGARARAHTVSTCDLSFCACTSRRTLLRSSGRPALGRAARRTALPIWFLLINNDQTSACAAQAALLSSESTSVCAQHAHAFRGAAKPFNARVVCNNNAACVRRR